MDTSSGSLFTERNVICPVVVGRRGALDAARALLDRVRNRAGGILLVAGEAGIGKSRMLRETAKQAREAGFVVFDGACFEADRAIPLAPLLDLVRGFSAANSPAVAAHAFASTAQELVRAFPELGSIFSALPPQESLDPEHERRRLFHAFAECVIALGRTQPILITFEDLHWADEPSLDLILYLARKIAEQPIALVLSYRRDEVAPPLERLLAELDRTRIATEPELARFSVQELEDMLRSIFDGDPPAGGFVETMHGLTDGNPFFVEEVLKALVIAGDVTRRTDGTWQARPLARVQVPRTAVEAVRRRLSALTVPARDVASAAAVIGRRFDFAFLQALTGHDERALLALIRELIGAQLVVEESPDRFAFRHALTREAIAGELLARERAALHRAVADELQRAGNSAGANIEAIAYHAYGAMDWPRALEASVRAAEHALKLHAPRETLAHLDRANDAAQRSGIAPTARRNLLRGNALETLGNFAGAHDCFDAALRAAQHDNDAIESWEALHALGMLWAARDYPRAGEYRMRALALAREINDARLIALSLNRVANWHVNLEQAAPALRGHAEALALFEQLGDRRGVAETVDLLAMAHFIASDIPQAAAQYLRALEMHEAMGNARGVSSAIGLLFLCSASIHVSCTVAGPTPVAADLDNVERTLKLTHDIGWRAGESFVRYLFADTLAWRGQYDRALPLVRESLAIAQEMEHLQWQCGSLRALGMMLLDVQSPALAREPLERAHAIAMRLGSATWIRWSAAPLAITLARLGQHVAAIEILERATVPSSIGREALREGDENSPTLGERYLMLAQVEVALAMSNPKRALKIADERIAAERADALSRNQSTAGEVPRLLLARAQALIDLDQQEQAEAALLEAQEQCIAFDAQPLCWRVSAALGQLYRTQRRRVESRAAFDQARALAGVLIARIPDEQLQSNFARQLDDIAPPLSPRTERQQTKASFGGLTARERDVARLVAQGKANRAIARSLGIGERTVEGYVAGALAKLGFSTRAQLAAWTVESGLNAASPKQKST